MNCKNCNSEMIASDNFCRDCGAKVVKERITLKSLFSNLLDALGWDSKFFITLRFLLYKPHTVLREYIDGTRKKYTNPFTFFAIITAFSIFVYSQFPKEIIQLSSDISAHRVEEMDDISTSSVNVQDAQKGRYLGYNSPDELTKGMMEFEMKYYNLFAFLLLPLYTLIAFLVFRKPYNYGEHLVINTYIQSMTSLFGVILFGFSLWIGINIFGNGVFIVLFLYYSYVYKKLYHLTFGQLLIKTLKLIGILLVLFIILAIIGIIIALLNASHAPS